MSLHGSGVAVGAVAGVTPVWRADGGGELPLYLLTPGVLITILVVLLVLVAVLGVVGWRVARLVRASPARARLQRGALTLRAAALPAGPRREVARLRASLHDNLTHTAHVLAAAPGGSGGPLGDLLAQLHAAAAQFDRQLRILADEPAEDYLTETLPALAARVAQFNDNTLSLRRSAVELTEDPDIQRRAEQDLRDRITGLAQGIRELQSPAEPTTAAWPVAPPVAPSREPGPLPALPPPLDQHRPAQPPSEGRTGPDRARETERGHPA